MSFLGKLEGKIEQSHSATTPLTEKSRQKGLPGRSATVQLSPLEKTTVVFTESQQVSPPLTSSKSHSKPPHRHRKLRKAGSAITLPSLRRTDIVSKGHLSPPVKKKEPKESTQEAPHSLSQDLLFNEKYPNKGVMGIGELEAYISSLEGQIPVEIELKGEESEQLETPFFNKESLTQILFAIIYQAVQITDSSSKEKDEKESEGNDELLKLQGLIKYLLDLPQVKEIIAEHEKLQGLADYAIQASIQGRQVLYLGAQKPQNIGRTLSKVSNHIHPCHYILCRKVKELEKIVGDCELTGLSFTLALGADPDIKIEKRKSKRLSQLGSKIFDSMSRKLKGEEAQNKKSAEEVLGETLDMIAMSAKYGVPAVFCRTSESVDTEKESEKPVTEPKNLLQRLLSLPEIQAILSNESSDVDILKGKVANAIRAVQKNKAADPFPKEASLERILAEVILGNGTIAQHLLMSHRHNPRLQDLAGLLINEAQFILSIDELRPGQKKLMLRNIVQFLTEYVKRGDSLPIVRSDQRKLRKQLVTFASRMSKALNGKLDLTGLQAALLASPLASSGKPIVEKQKKIIQDLGELKSLDESFQPAISLLIQAKKFGESKMAKSMCKALEKAVMARLNAQEVSLSDFERGLKLLEVATRLGLYQEPKAQNRLAALQSAIKAAAMKVEVPYKITDAEELSQDLSAILSPLFASVELGEVDGCLWTKPGKEYLTPNMDNLTKWYNFVSDFLRFQLLTNGNEKKARKMFAVLIEAASQALDQHQYLVLDCIMAALDSHPISRLGFEAHFVEHFNYRRARGAFDDNPKLFLSDAAFQLAEMQGTTILPGLRLFQSKLEFASQNKDLSEYQISLDNISLVTQIKNRLKFHLDNVRATTEEQQPDKERVRLIKLAIEIARWRGQLDDSELDRKSYAIKPLFQTM